MKAGWVYPFIILGGILQTCGAAMNGQLNKALVNPWLASTVSFALITAFFICTFAVFPTPLPTAQGLASMPWWAPLGGLVGAVQVYAGLTLVNKVGAEPFVCRYHCNCRPHSLAGHRPLRSLPYACTCR